MDKIINIINWYQLKIINKSKFINTMYIWIFLVPIAARLLENVNESATVTIFNYTFEAQLTLPFSWLVFYFSAMAFAIANLIFQFRCPDIVKEHDDYTDFKQANMGVEHLDSYMDQVDLKWAGLDRLLEGQDQYFIEIADAQNPKQDDGLLRKRFWAVYLVAKSHRHKSKITALILYAIGFFLFSIVLIQNIIFVVGYLCK